MTLLTTKELEERLKVSRDTIFRWREQEGLPFKRIGKAAIRFDWVEVEKWIEKRNK